MKNLAAAIILHLLVFISAAFASPVKVVTSFSILEDIVKEIGGEHIAVTNLVARGSDAHHYEPTPRDARALKDSQLVFINGLGFDDWVIRLKEASGSKAEILALSESLPHLRYSEADKESDPHTWQDVSNVRLFARQIAKALIAVDPGHAAFYQERTRIYDQKLSELDRWIKEQFAPIPSENRIILSSHDAFGYFSAAYGVIFVAPIGLNNEAEPSAQRLGGLIGQIKQGKIKALFLEHLADPKTLIQIAEETGVHIGGELYADTLSDPTGPAPDYLSLMRYNVGQLLLALKNP